MRSKTMRVALLLATFFIFFNTSSIFGIEVRLVEKVGLSSPNGFTPIKTQGFCLLEDEMFISPIQTEGKLEIAEFNGSHFAFLKAIGQKGVDFLEPTFCSYNKKESKFSVIDFGKRQILIYDRTGRDELILAREISCPRLATDIQLIGEKGTRLLVAGYMTDENEYPYDLYEVNLINGQITPLLHSYDKYGLASDAEYKAKYRGKDRDAYMAKGLDSWFDVVEEDNIYYAWSANYKIVKINIKSREAVSFGQKPRNYVEPSTDKLLAALKKKDKQMMETAKQSMSYINKVFTTEDSVLVIFEGPFNKGNSLNFTLQLYDLTGKYIGEKNIPGQPGDRMQFDKDKNMLYSLSKNSLNNPGYIISKYSISK